MTIEAAKPVQPCVPQAEDFYRQYDVDTFRPEPGAHCGPKPRPNMISSDELFAPPADQFAPPDLSHWGGTPAPERTAEEIFAPPADPFAPPDLSSWGGTPPPTSKPSESCGCGGSCDGQCGAGCAGNCGGGCSSKRRAPAVQEWPPKDPDALDVEAEWARYYAQGGRRGGPRAVELASGFASAISDLGCRDHCKPDIGWEKAGRTPRRWCNYSMRGEPMLTGPMVVPGDIIEQRDGACECNPFSRDYSCETVDRECRATVAFTVAFRLVPNERRCVVVRRTDDEGNTKELWRYQPRWPGQSVDHAITVRDCQNPLSRGGLFEFVARQGDCYPDPPTDDYCVAGVLYAYCPPCHYGTEWCQSWFRKIFRVPE